MYCIVHAGRDVRLPSALLGKGCSLDQVESQFTKLFPMLACLEASKEEPRTGQGLWGREVGGKQQGKATKHVPQLSQWPGRSKNANHMKNQRNREGQGRKAGPREGNWAERIQNRKWDGLCCQEV